MLSKVVKAGHRAILSNYDALYLDCGGGNWITGGDSWCAPFKTWQTIWGNEPLNDTSLNAAERAGVVAIASAADMVINFPLWIVAKRASAECGLRRCAARQELARRRWVSTPSTRHPWEV